MSPSDAAAIDDTLRPGRVDLMVNGRYSFVLYLALTSSLVLYVYRFFVVAANVSPFRIVLIAWMAMTLVDVARGRLRFGVHDRWFLGLCAVLVAINVSDFLRSRGHHELQRDTVNHVVNMCFAALVALSLRTDRDVTRLVNAFIASSVLAAAVALYADVSGHLPFESLVRAGAQGLTVHDLYSSDDTVFKRATSAFFDPNFYGIYCVFALLCVMYAWLYETPRPILAMLFAVNLACLALTLSRTAVVGFVAAMVVAAWVERRARLFAAASALAAVVLLPAATLIQSEAYRASLIASGRRWASSLTTSPPARKPLSSTASAPGPAAPAPPLEHAPPPVVVVTSRATSSQSLSLRLPFILNGLRVVQEHPLWGGGAASLLIPNVPYATAHLTYLSILARYGAFAAVPYFIFIFGPFVFVLASRTRTARRYAFLVGTTMGALLVTYLAYDTFMFFELQYLFFGIGYAIVLGTAGHGGWLAPADRAAAVRAGRDGRELRTRAADLARAGSSE